MNKLSGKINAVETSEELSIVSVDLGNDIQVKTVIIENQGDENLYKVGEEVIACFKETEVAIGRGELGNISLQNQLAGKIIEVKEGKLLGRVDLETEVGRIVAIISSNAINTLGLSAGIKATALIKLNEIILSR